MTSSDFQRCRQPTGPASELQDPHWNLGFSSFQDSTSRHLEPSPNYPGLVVLLAICNFGTSIGSVFCLGHPRVTFETSGCHGRKEAWLVGICVLLSRLKTSQKWESLWSPAFSPKCFSTHNVLMFDAWFCENWHRLVRNNSENPCTLFISALGHWRVASCSCGQWNGDQHRGFSSVPPTTEPTEAQEKTTFFGKKMRGSPPNLTRLAKKHSLETL